MPFFSVIIPTHNSEKTVVDAIMSVDGQSFIDYDLIVVDDVSTDNTPILVQSLFDRRIAYFMEERVCSGGARNRGANIGLGDSHYTLFLDADDVFVDDKVFQELHDFIVDHNYPDMVRLPYIRHNEDGTTVDQTPNILKEKTIEDVARSPRVACWTKAVKTELLQEFPENTLCEDVCQHLKQCDVVESVAWFPRAVVQWNIHSNSTSNSCTPKWKSSCYRFVADLMDLELEEPYTKARRDVKLAEAIQNLKEGKWLQ